MGKRDNRYLILAAACYLNFIHGCAYIWTVFQPYVQADFHLSTAGSSQPFTFIIALFPVGNIIGGKLQHKIGARNTILFSNLVMAGGFILAALATPQSAFLLSVGYGMIGGLASGAAFGVTVVTAQNWFPDRIGMATGMTLGVVGVSGVFMNPLCDLLLKHLGFRAAMLTVAALYIFIVLTGVWFIREPTGKSEEAAADASLKERQYTTTEMVKTGRFYMIALSMALVIPAYVIVNPLMKSFALVRGLSDSAALGGVVAASSANIVARFVTPWASDRVGRKQMILVNYVIMTAGIFAMITVRGGFYVACISAISFAYGSVAGLYPALVADYFGLKYQAANNGMSMIGFGLVSLFCPYLVNYTEGTRMGIEGAFLAAGILGIIGFVITLKIKKKE